MYFTLVKNDLWVQPPMFYYPMSVLRLSGTPQYVLMYFLLLLCLLILHLRSILLCLFLI